MNTLNTVGIADLYLQMKIADATRTTLCVMSDPGMGKTQIRRQTALEYLRSVGAPECNYIYFNAGTKTAEFFGMSVPLVKNGTCDFITAEWVRKLAKAGPCVVCFDEFDKTPSYRDQMPYLQWLTEGGVDNIRLDNCLTTVMGNFRTNGGGSAGISPIVMNRVRQVHYRPEDSAVLQYGVASGWHEWVTGYLMQNPSATNDYRADRPRNCSSRQWEGVSNDIKALFKVMPNATAREVVQTVATRVPDERAQEFGMFLQYSKDIVPFDVIVADPEGAPMPASEDRGVHWMQVNTAVSRAAGMRLKDKFNGMNRSQCITAAYRYVKRFAPEFLLATHRLMLTPAIDSKDYAPGATIFPSGTQLDASGNRVGDGMLDELVRAQRILTEE